MNKTRIGSLFLGLLVLPGTLWSAGGGTSGGTILGIPVGARAIAMGEAYTAMADDVSSLYWNPAGIALLNQSEASFMYTQWLQDLTYHNASVAMPLENGGLGASLSYLSYGHIDAVDTNGDAAGNVNAYSGVATLGAGWLGNLWSAGFNIKGVQEQLADVTANGIAADLGANVIFPKEINGGTLRVGATIRNLGSGLKYIDQRDPFPTEWRVGMAAAQMMNRKLNISLDYGQERNLDSAVYFGTEYWVLPMIALRAGYTGSHDESAGIRAGLGLKVKDFAFNYAYSPFGDLGMTHRYELSMKFGTIRPVLTPEMRRMLRQAKIAMAEGRYGEATMLLDSLLEMAPHYKPFQRLVKTAMKGYESQGRMAQGREKMNWSHLSAKKAGQEDKQETEDLEALLNMANSYSANAAPANLQPSNKGGQAQ